MKSRILGLAALIVASLAVLSCQGTSDVPPALKGIHETVTANGDTFWVNVAAVGDWTVSVDYIDQDGWIHLDKASDSGKASVGVTVDPNDDESPRKARLIVKTSNDEVSKEITQMGKVTAATCGWLELPSFDQKEGFFFGTHSMDGGAYKSQKESGVRNWSFYYDYDAYVSWWVAYPLNSRLRGSGSRSDSWQATDPLLPADAVCNVTIKYGGGWTRGHQIPSADRLDYAANVSTFYPTNMTPQDYDLNDGIWKHLEEQVRNWSFSSDTLYVCTGADIRNSYNWSGNNTGHRAKVPTHYYKALLRKRGQDYSAVGYYMPHTSSIAGEDFQDYIYSISALESLTGIDFFVNLPALLGADKAKEIEEASPSETLKNW